MVDEYSIPIYCILPKKCVVKEIPVSEWRVRDIHASDAVYLISEPSLHYEQIKMAIEKGKHILCETPLVLNRHDKEKFHILAAEHNCILMDSIKTAYSTAYSRLLLLAKTGKVGKIVSVDATATSLKEKSDIEHTWQLMNVSNFMLLQTSESC